jgi:hypothetical protein
MVKADVAPSGDKFVVVQLCSSGEGEAIGASDGDMAGGVFVEEGIVEELSAFADGGGGWYEGNLAEAMRAFVSIH